MREPPTDLSVESLRKSLERNYGMAVNEVTFLPLGHDSSAWVYRANARGGAAYFVKVKLALPGPAALAVPHRLIENGMTGVVAPIATSSGQLSTTVSRYALIVYPFAATETGMNVGLTDQQWTDFGVLLREVHDTPITPDLEVVLERDRFDPEGADTVRKLDPHIDGRAFADEGRKVIAAFWAQRRTQILSLLDRAEELGGRLARGSPPYVLCHADAHTNNLLVGANGRIWLVDWDGTVLAPRERDLMFVIGGIGPGWVSAEQEAHFLDGYGPIDVDPVALAYYRYAWAVSDIASFGEQVFFRPDLGAVDHAESVWRFQTLFEPGSIVDIALGTQI